MRETKLLDADPPKPPATAAAAVIAAPAIARPATSAKPSRIGWHIYKQSGGERLNQLSREGSLAKQLRQQGCGEQKKRSQVGQLTRQPSSSSQQSDRQGSQVAQHGLQMPNPLEWLHRHGVSGEGATAGAGGARGGLSRLQHQSGCCGRQQQQQQQEDEQRVGQEEEDQQLGREGQEQLAHVVQGGLKGSDTSVGIRAVERSCEGAARRRGLHGSASAMSVEQQQQKQWEQRQQQHKGGGEEDDAEELKGLLDDIAEPAEGAGNSVPKLAARRKRWDVGPSELRDVGPSELQQQQQQEDNMELEEQQHEPQQQEGPGQGSGYHGVMWEHTAGWNGGNQTGGWGGDQLGWSQGGQQSWYNGCQGAEWGEGWVGGMQEMVTPAAAAAGGLDPSWGSWSRGMPNQWQPASGYVPSPSPIPLVAAAAAVPIPPPRPPPRPPSPPPLPAEAPPPDGQDDATALAAASGEGGDDDDDDHNLPPLPTEPPPSPPADRAGKSPLLLPERDDGGLAIPAAGAVPPPPPPPPLEDEPAPAVLGSGSSGVLKHEAELVPAGQGEVSAAAENGSNAPGTAAKAVLASGADKGHGQPHSLKVSVIRPASICHLKQRQRAAVARAKSTGHAADGSFPVQEGRSSKGSPSGLQHLVTPAPPPAEMQVAGTHAAATQAAAATAAACEPPTSGAAGGGSVPDSVELSKWSVSPRALHSMSANAAAAGGASGDGGMLTPTQQAELAAAVAAARAAAAAAVSSPKGLRAAATRKQPPGAAVRAANFAAAVFEDNVAQQQRLATAAAVATMTGLQAMVTTATRAAAGSGAALEEARVTEQPADARAVTAEAAAAGGVVGADGGSRGGAAAALGAASGMQVGAGRQAVAQAGVMNLDLSKLSAIASCLGYSPTDSAASKGACVGGSRGGAAGSVLGRQPPPPPAAAAAAGPREGLVEAPQAAAAGRTVAGMMSAVPLTVFGTKEGVVEGSLLQGGAYRGSIAQHSGGGFAASGEGGFVRKRGSQQGEGGVIYDITDTSNSIPQVPAGFLRRALFPRAAAQAVSLGSHQQRQQQQEKLPRKVLLYVIENGEAVEGMSGQVVADLQEVRGRRGSVTGGSGEEEQCYRLCGVQVAAMCRAHVGWDVVGVEPAHGGESGGMGKALPNMRLLLRGPRVAAGNAGLTAPAAEGLSAIVPASVAVLLPDATAAVGPAAICVVATPIIATAAVAAGTVAGHSHIKMEEETGPSVPVFAGEPAGAWLTSLRAAAGSDCNVIHGSLQAAAAGPAATAAGPGPAATAAGPAATAAAAGTAAIAANKKRVTDAGRMHLVTAQWQGLAPEAAQLGIPPVAVAGVERIAKEEPEGEQSEGSGQMERLQPSEGLRAAKQARAAVARGLSNGTVVEEHVAWGEGARGEQAAAAGVGAAGEVVAGTTARECTADFEPAAKEAALAAAGAEARAAAAEVAAGRAAALEVTARAVAQSLAATGELEAPRAHVEAPLEKVAATEALPAGSSSSTSGGKDAAAPSSAVAAVKPAVRPIAVHGHGDVGRSNSGVTQETTASAVTATAAGGGGCGFVTAGGHAARVAAAATAAGVANGGGGGAVGVVGSGPEASMGSGGDGGGGGGDDEEYVLADKEDIEDAATEVQDLCEKLKVSREHVLVGLSTKGYLLVLVQRCGRQGSMRVWW